MLSFVNGKSAPVNANFDDAELSENCLPFITIGPLVTGAPVVEFVKYEVGRPSEVFCHIPSV